MLRRVKKWLGIEGVKIEIQPDEIDTKNHSISGTLVFSSMHEQVISSYKIKLIEKYSRGRRKKKITDEYLLGEKVVNEIITVPNHMSVDREFTLNFKPALSKIEKFGNRNPLFAGISEVAKLTKGVKSTYRIEVEADVVGTALSPFHSVDIEM